MQIHTTNHFVAITLSESNLRNLLPDHEMRGDTNVSRQIDGKFVVVAVESDASHYSDRPRAAASQQELAAELAQEREALEASA